MARYFVKSVETKMFYILIRLDLEEVGTLTLIRIGSFICFAESMHRATESAGYHREGLTKYLSAAE